MEKLRIRYRIIVAIITVIFAVISVPIHAQQVIETEPLPTFSAITTIGALQVKLIPSDTARVHMVLWDLKMKDVEWRVKDERLTLTARRGFVNKQAYAEVRIYYNSLREIRNEGATITSDTTLIAPALRIDAISSTGTIELAIESDDLYINTSGNNSVALTGKAQHSHLRAKLGSRIESYALTSANAVAIASEGSAIELRGVESVDLKAYTGGKIGYICEVNTIRNVGKKTLFGTITEIGNL